MSPSDKRLHTGRENWARRSWRRSERGNSFLNVRGFNITVFGGRRGFGIKIEQRHGERCQFGKRRYESRADAQAAAFDALIWAEQSWGGNGRYQVPEKCPPNSAGPAAGRDQDLSERADFPA